MGQFGPECPAVERYRLDAAPLGQAAGRLGVVVGVVRYPREIDRSAGAHEGEHGRAVVQQRPLPLRRDAVAHHMREVGAGLLRSVADAGPEQDLVARRPDARRPSAPWSPPNQSVFSSTTARRPCCAAASAAVIPARAAAHHDHVELCCVGLGLVRCHGTSRASILEHVPVLAESSREAPVPQTPVPQTPVPQTPVPPTWDIQADVVVVGFGAAGACAALEAAEAGADVIVLDRFHGGGATALSGGVVYAGGGTRQQRDADVQDSPEAMFRYLSLEVGDAVSPATLREFCEGSPAMLAWLERNGVPFEGSLCPDKTSYPTNRHYLYYSGSELSGRAAAAPAPRGHRTHGRGTSGGLFFERLAEAVRGSGARAAPQTSARQLIMDGEGRVVGVECRTLARRAALGPGRAPGPAPLVGQAVRLRA